jgi:hypothetical protein
MDKFLDGQGFKLVRIEYLCCSYLCCLNIKAYGACFPKTNCINSCGVFGLITILLNIWNKASPYAIFEIKMKVGQRQTHTRIISKD